MTKNIFTIQYTHSMNIVELKTSTTDKNINIDEKKRWNDIIRNNKIKINNDKLQRCIKWIQLNDINNMNISLCNVNYKINSLIQDAINYEYKCKKYIFKTNPLLLQSFKNKWNNYKININNKLKLAKNFKEINEVLIYLYTSRIYIYDMHYKLFNIYSETSIKHSESYEEILKSDFISIDKYDSECDIVRK